MNDTFNTRILVIDDDETVRDSFREILIPRRKNRASLEKASAGLFDDDIPLIKHSSGVFDFELTEAASGQEGLAAVQKSLEEKKPFAAIFVDMRMPGWDGLTTVQLIRKFDHRAEIVFVTAYSDHSIEEIVERAGANVGYHCKPFSIEEIRQIATKAVYEWNKIRNLEELIEIISHLRTHQWQLKPLLNNILHQVSAMVGAFSAMLAVQDQTNNYKKIIGIGKLSDDEVAQEYLSVLPELVDKKIYQTDLFAYFQVEKYGILAFFESGIKPVLNNERLYTVRLFLEQAALALANVDLQEELLRKEKLSAVGEAVGMIAHDLRGPIGGICKAIQLAEQMADDRDFVKEIHDMMATEAKKTLRMVNDVLDFTRNSTLTKSPVDITPLLESVQKNCEQLLKETGVQLCIESCKSFQFPGDESKMERVFINLIQNAAEALSQHKTEHPEIILSAKPDTNGFYFSISDNGPGIPEQIRNQLFIPFVSYGKKSGTGLGLAIVKQFVDAHGGRISVDTSSKGTVFEIFLPDT